MSEKESKREKEWKKTKTISYLESTITFLLAAFWQFNIISPDLPKTAFATTIALMQLSWVNWHWTSYL